MSILIENDTTLEYLSSAGKWTVNPKAAKRFRMKDEAFEVATQESVGKFTIVLHIPETNQFVNLDHGKGKGAPQTVSDEAAPDQS